MRCCKFKRDLDEILELFLACTQLPITALTQEEGSQGEIATTTEQGERAFVYILPICPCARQPGVFILGPYLTTPDMQSQLTYRPLDAWPYLISLLRNLQGYGASPRREQRRLAGKPHCLPIYRAQRIIQENSDQNLTLEGTAAHLGLNRSYLSTLFKQETGQTFTEYVQEVRVEHSKKLLAESAASILDIALQVGFTSQNYYSRIFKKLTGQTPSEFRQQSQASFQELNQV